MFLPRFFTKVGIPHKCSLCDITYPVLMPVDINEQGEDWILAYAQQELQDAIDAELPGEVIAYAQERVDKIADDIKQLEEAPWPDVPCRTCTGHRLIEVTCSHCSECEQSFTLIRTEEGIGIYYPVSENEPNSHGEKINYYPRDENGRPHVPRTGEVA